MTQKKKRAQKGSRRDHPTKAGGPGGKAPRAPDGDSLVEATHQVVEDEVRHGEAPPAPGPDQKGEPGSAV